MTFLVSGQAEVSPTVQSTRKGLVGCVQHYKGAMPSRFYAICNCCSCCWGAMHAHRHGTPMLASGYVAHVALDLCAGCGLCADQCQFAAISVDNGHADVDSATCMGCGVCVAKCPQEALSLLHDRSHAEPLEIRELIASTAGQRERLAAGKAYSQGNE